MQKKTVQEHYHSNSALCTGSQLPFSEHEFKATKAHKRRTARESHSLKKAFAVRILNDLKSCERPQTKSYLISTLFLASGSVSVPTSENLKNVISHSSQGVRQTNDGILFVFFALWKRAQQTSLQSPCKKMKS